MSPLGTIATLKAPEAALQASRVADAWFASGDVGSIDTDEHLQITNGQKDPINAPASGSVPGADVLRHATTCLESH